MNKKVCECYKEYDGCYLGHYAQCFFWFSFTIGIFVVAGGVGVLIAQYYAKMTNRQILGLDIKSVLL